MDENTCFLPTVKGEIGAFAWHIIEHLPSTGEAARQVWLNAEGGRHRFFLVSTVNAEESNNRRGLLKMGKCQISVVL